MAGIYLHIPFCKQACHYCNFHFSTSLRYKNGLLDALLKEMELQRDFPGLQQVHTVYFGGGTPSLLDAEELQVLMTRLKEVYTIQPDAEITLEANPDDISMEKLLAWKTAGINRLSIGIQSFFEEDLRWMNRAHNAAQAEAGLTMALKLFDNITIDLIYGTPGLTDEKWKANVDKALALGIPHLSCYALTVEPKTPLDKLIHKKQYQPVDPDAQSAQFLMLMDWLETAGFEHYEISNFARHGHRSRHNGAYWQQQVYLGLGPAAHSYDGLNRQWNIANNQVYIRRIQEGIVPAEKEILTDIQRMNEYIMIALRTGEGLDPGQLPDEARALLQKNAEKYITSGHIAIQQNRLLLTREGKLLADGIAAALFF